MSWNFPYLVITRADVEKYTAEEERASVETVWYVDSI